MVKQTKPRRRASVPQAKNIMRRVVNEILDPSPTDVGPIWDYFADRCAYCDVLLDRDQRTGHVDHAESRGGNHLGNLVLVCSRCNGDAKRDELWQAFLRRTVADEAEAARREGRITEWNMLHPRAVAQPTEHVSRLVEEIEQLVNDFAVKCDELRSCIRRGE